MRRITEEAISNFARRLRQEDRSPGTQENYLRHIRTFTRWMGNLPVTRRALHSGKPISLTEAMLPARSTLCWCRLTGSSLSSAGATAK